MKVQHALSAAALAVAAAVMSAGCAPHELALADYETSCSKDADCVAVWIGECNPNACTCPNAAIAASSVTQYESDLAALDCGGQECPCAFVAPVCTKGTCSITQL